MAQGKSGLTIGDLVARPESLPQKGYVRIARREPLSAFDDYAMEGSAGVVTRGGDYVVRAEVLRDALMRYAVLHPLGKAELRVCYLGFYLRHFNSIAPISLPARVGYGAACFDAFAKSAGLRDEAVTTISNVLWSFLAPARRASWRETAQFQIPPTHEGFRALFEDRPPDAVIASLEEIVDWVVDAGSCAIEHGAADFGSIGATIGAMHVVARCGAALPPFAPFEASPLAEADGWERDVSMGLRERAHDASPFRG